MIKRKEKKKKKESFMTIISVNFNFQRIEELSKRILYVNKCFKDIFCTSFQRHFPYVMDVSKTSLVCHKCIEAFQRHLLYVISKTFSVRYGCLKCIKAFQRHLY